MSKQAGRTIITRQVMVDKTIEGLKSDWQYIRKQSYRDLHTIRTCFFSLSVEENDPQAKAVLSSYAKYAEMEMRSR